jgi:hypothetical protein
MVSEWQENFESFVDALAEKLRGGASEEDLAEHFGGELVNWSGFLYEKDLNELAPAVTIDLPERFMDLGGGRSTTLGGFSLLVAHEAISAWRALPIGGQVKFSARLGSKQSTFTPIGVQRFSSGRVLILVRLADGRPR